MDISKDEVIEDCPRPRGQLEDKKIVALALDSIPAPTLNP